MAFSGIIGAPLVWLVALQAGYTLAYQACDARSNAWVIVPTVAAIAIVGATLGLAAVARRRAAPEPRPLLMTVALGMAALSLLVLVASIIPPLLLHPCD